MKDSGDGGTGKTPGYGVKTGYSKQCCGLKRGPGRGRGAAASLVSRGGESSAGTTESSLTSRMVILDQSRAADPPRAPPTACRGALGVKERPRSRMTADDPEPRSGPAEEQPLASPGSGG